MPVARQRIHLPPAAWRRAISSVLRGTLWEGDAIAEMEHEFARFIGAADAVVVPSGRAGLRFIFETLGLEPGSEVVCSAFAYPVVPHLARTLGFDVRFADVELDTLGMDPSSLESVISDRTKLVIATHLYGVPCRIREIRDLVETHGATLIEDCAHCYGASIAGKAAGSFGAFGYFSFETSKPVNTMGGGIVTTADAVTASRIREIAARQQPKNLSWLRSRLVRSTFEATVTHPLPFAVAVYPALRLLQGRDSSDDRFASGYQPDETTMEGRMGRFTNYQAALGLDQMRKVLPILGRRIGNAERLMGALRDIVRFQSNDDPEVRSNYMLVTALFEKMEEVSRRLLRLGVDTKHHYMRDCTAISEHGGSFPNAARAEREVLHLPAYPELSDAKIDWIAGRVRRVVEGLTV
ncbi:MAG: aminotransferase class I/II-fold pyridoxal phosphate-dependent enzyme [Acidobacteriota bacterium]